MIEEAVKLGGGLKGEMLIIYAIIVGQFLLIFYLFKFIVRVLNEISNRMGVISEQVRTLVQAAFIDSKKG